MHDRESGRNQCGNPCDTLEFPVQCLRETRMETLGRQKQDVANKTRSNIFGWRGQFTPEWTRS